MDTDIQTTEKLPTHRQIVLLVILTAVTSVIAALAHTAILLFSYDPSLGVYAYGEAGPVIFIAGTVIGLIAVAIAAFSVPSGTCGLVEMPLCGTAEAFFAAMTGAAMFAYSVMNAITVRIPSSGQTAASDGNAELILWTVMAALSIPSAAYLIISAVTKAGSAKKLTVLGFFPVLWTAVCLLRIYFDRTSAINNPVKLYSQMALAAIMLYFLSELRIRVGKPVLRMYAAFAGISAMLGFSYSVSVIAASLAGVDDLSGELLLAVIILLSSLYGFSRIAAMRNRF